ncbi:MAG: isoprenylcysteine carboxylmethyltransferase family protein [Saprospiraceae bacterium]
MRINFDHIFQPATSQNGKWNLLKTTLQSVLFWIVFLYVLPQLIIRLESSSLAIPTFPTYPILGWSLLVGFSLLNIYCGYTMSWYGKGTPLPLDCPQELVIQGPYRVVRNPMAVAGIGQGVSVGIILGSYLVVIYALIGAVLWHILVRPTEEADLLARFGAAYFDYKKEVKCWIPRFS